jgi:hypothetical protein
MKIRRMNDPNWTVPLEELEPSIKLALNIQWRDFIEQLDNAGAVSFDPADTAERHFLEDCWWVA